MPVNTITKTKTGWRYRRGDHEIKSRKGESKRDFSTRCDIVDNKIDALGSGDIDMTLDQLFERWIEDHVRVNLSPGEPRVIVPIYEAFVKPYHGDRNITIISRGDVYTRLSEVVKRKPDASRSLISKIRGCYSRPYNWACNALGLNLSVPTRGLVFTTPRPQAVTESSPVKRERNITAEEYARFIGAASGLAYENYFRIIYLTGLRPSECLGLQVRDIKDGHLEIRRAITKDGISHGKTRKAKRDIPITNELRAILRDQAAKKAFASKEGWLFATNKQLPSMEALRTATRKLVRKSGVKLSLYDFRHTFATRMVEQGMPPTMLQHLMGHEDIVTTLKYYPEMTAELFEQAREFMENGKKTGNSKEA